MPVLERISIRECANVTSLQTERFGEFSCLGDFTVSNCPKLFHNSGSLSVPTLKNLELRNSGILLSNIECSSLTSLSFKCVHVTAIPIQPLNGNLPSLQEFNINECESLTFFAESYPLNGAFSFLTVLVIRSCHKLPTLDGLLKKEYLPAIERIEIGACTGLLSLPGERFGSFTCLSDLRISHCPNINWQSGLVLPSYLKRLSLNNCGNFSAWFPNCLGSLTCLVELTMIECHGIESFPNQTWRSNLASLKKLHIADCPDLVSIGAVNPILKIKTVYIYSCQKLTKVKQPFIRSRE